MPIKMEWDSLFWMLAAFSVLYVSEFASHIIFDDIVKRFVIITPPPSLPSHHTTLHVHTTHTGIGWLRPCWL